MKYYKKNTDINNENYLYLSLVKSTDVAHELAKNNYSLLQSFLNSNELLSKGWDSFKKSWENLCLDEFMNDNGQYRYRRYSVFTWDSNLKRLIIEEKQPHYQTIGYNPLNGNIERHFELFEESTIHNNIFNKIMSFCINILNQIHKDEDWHIEAHQYRIVAKSSEKGLPTPEGIHRDGRDYVMIMFIGKEGIKGGETTIYDLNNTPLFNFTLKHPSETVFLNDDMVMHGVSPIEPSNELLIGKRDVLVITFIKKEKATN